MIDYFWLIQVENVGKIETRATRCNSLVSHTLDAPLYFSLVLTPRAPPGDETTLL